MMKRILITCDKNPDYFYYAPITAMFWGDHFQYRVTLGLVGSPHDWLSDPLGAYMIETAQKNVPGIEIVFLDRFSRLPSYVVALLMRFFLALKYPDDLCLTWDVDMLPLSRTYYRMEEGHPFVYFDPGVFGDPPYKIAAGYLAASGRVWGEVLGVHHYEDVTETHLESILTRYYPKDFLNRKKIQANDARTLREIKVNEAGFWDADQKYLTDLLLSPQHRDKIYRKPYKREVDLKTQLLNDRIDRARWEFDVKKADTYLDAHAIVHAPWDRSDIKTYDLERIIEFYHPEKSAVIKNYTDRFSDVRVLHRFEYPRAIVTAASSAYAPHLLNLIGSIQQNDPNHPPILVYDLGLSPILVRCLDALEGVTVKKVPPFVPHWRKCYTWKLYVLCDVPAENIYFLDAASEVLRSLHGIFQKIETDGYFCASQASFKYTLADILPSDLLRYLGMRPEAIRGLEYFAGGNFGFKKRTVYDECVKRAFALAKAGWTLGWSIKEKHKDNGWNQCGMIRDCKLFRHDQSLLNAVFRKELVDFKIHDEDQYASLYPSAHPNQLVWNRRNTGPQLGYLSRLCFRKPSSLERRIMSAILSIYVKRYARHWVKRAAAQKTGRPCTTAG